MASIAKHLTRFIVVLIVIAAALRAPAQDPQWNAELQLIAPSPYLSDWSSRRNTATLLITNSSGTPRNVKILADIEMSGDLAAYTKPEKVGIRTIQPGQPQMFFGENIVPYVAFHFEGTIGASAQRAGRIPDGVVCVRAKVVDAQTGALLDDDYKCATIVSFVPAYLLLPEDKAILCRLGANNVIEMNTGNPRPMFRWAPVVPAPPEPVRYHFAIFEVLPGQNPLTAFRSARPLFERDLVGVTELLWPLEFFYPEAGKRYIWSARALDANGLPLASYQDGWATPFAFTVVDDCGEGNIDTDGDGIPDMNRYGEPLDYRSDLTVRITTADPSPLDPDIRHEFTGAARSLSGGPFVFRWFVREHDAQKFKPLSAPSNLPKLTLAPYALKPDHSYDLRLTAERNGIFGKADLEARTGESSLR